MADVPPPQPQGSTTPNANANANTNRPTVRIHFTPANNNVSNGTPTIRIGPTQAHHPHPSSSSNSNPATSNVRRIALPPIPPPPPLPPLQPQPLPHSRPTTAVEDNPQLKKYECAICFEYLNQPVGCGSCPVRFCKSCLERAVLRELQQQQQQQQQQQHSSHSSNNNNGEIGSAKCPHCRSIIRPPIHLDVVLWNEMKSCSIPISCPFDGCNETALTLQTLAEHERTCPHLPVACPYAPYGCEWNGKSSQYSHHQSSSCRYEPWKQFIESHRKHTWEIRHVISQHYGLMGLNHALIHANRTLIMQRTNYSSSSGNIVYIGQLVWEAMCFPERFLQHGSSSGGGGSTVWMVNGVEERGMILNICLSWPFLGMGCRLALMGVKCFPRMVQLMIERDAEVYDDEIWDLVDAMALSAAVTVMAILVVVCFYMDSESAVKWGRYKIGILDGPLIQYIAAVAMAMITYSWIDFFGYIRGYMVWNVVATLSLVHTSFLAGMIEKLCGASNVLESARHLDLVVFGLRYGFLIYTCDFLPSVGAMLVLHLVPTDTRNNMQWFFGVPSTECFLALIGSSHAAIAIVAYLASIASLGQDHLLHSLVQVIVALSVLVCLNIYVFALQWAGAKLATLNSPRGLSTNNNAASGAELSTQRPSPVGISVAAAFVFTSILMSTI